MWRRLRPRPMVRDASLRDAPHHGESGLESGLASSSLRPALILRSARASERVSKERAADVAPLAPAAHGSRRVASRRSSPRGVGFGVGFGELFSTPRPHPEERSRKRARLEGEGGRCGAACARGPWFETRRFATLLTTGSRVWSRVWRALLYAPPSS